MFPPEKENLSTPPTARESAVHDADGISSWRSTLYVMFTAQLLSIVGFAFVLPFIPFYIREIGVTDEKLQRVHSPIGLELNAETPEEIAVSIMAEIIMQRNGGDGRSMLWKVEARPEVKNVGE